MAKPSLGIAELCAGSCANPRLYPCLNLFSRLFRMKSLEILPLKFHGSIEEVHRDRHLLLSVHDLILVAEGGCLLDEHLDQGAGGGRERAVFEPGDDVIEVGGRPGTRKRNGAQV